jgi:hypothetical protein
VQQQIRSGLFDVERLVEVDRRRRVERDETTIGAIDVPRPQRLLE